MKQIFRSRFDSNIMLQFNKAIKIMASHPLRLPIYLRLAGNQLRAATRRKEQLKLGIEVPPLMIISITKRCNLNCRGCYSKLLHRDESEELSAAKLDEIMKEAVSLGISIVLLAGGEPLIRRDILEIAARYPQILFPVFTNGLMLDEDYAEFFGRHPHLIPVVSLEGGKAETDFRRGEGVYQNFGEVISLLNRKKVFWGISLTLTSANIGTVLTEDYSRSSIAKGCRLFFFVEYVPVAEGSDELLLSEAQKNAVQPRVDELMKHLPALFIAFPGDEDQYDGCLAAGRGFLHINPNGKVEPCPFAPFSDIDLRQGTLMQALKSPVLAKIREFHHLLKEGRGGCALWANQEQVREILKS